MNAELARLDDDDRRRRNWKRWGPYLAERQWGTVREDYSADGNCWDYFPHDHARSRAYRWGEDGLLGFCDRECRVSFALALWNGRDPILKERLFGLTNREGNHGEDVKESYFYLDATPTYSYAKALYKYPQQEFPYARLLEENGRRGARDREFELADTGIFDESRYFDVFAEYAKAGPDDLAIRITVWNRGPEAAALHLLPTLWFRNTWSWGRTGEGYWPKGRISRLGDGSLAVEHASLGRMALETEGGAEFLFTENETNFPRLYGLPGASPYAKDAFHECVIHGNTGAVNPARAGSKAAAWYRLQVPAGGSSVIRLRLFAESERQPDSLDQVFEQRIREAGEFYGRVLNPKIDEAARAVSRQACAGLLWSRQFYHYVVEDWLDGDPGQPAPPAARLAGRNREWRHVYNRDVISMPDKWEYPWFAAWDLAFHMLPFARLDPRFAKDQLLLLLREWYMHPNGQVPAYEFAFSDVNPPVHAWACWRVYKMTAPRGGRDRLFLERAFHKLLLNFTWWVNRKDIGGKNVFAGGFLGLDNIGVFDRSKPLPGGEILEQADGTAWMAFYCLTMLSIALELAREDPAYEDVASKFFEHFVAIADATNEMSQNGLWDEQDGFYYDQVHMDGQQMPLRVRSLVGLIPLLAVEVLDQASMDRLPGFTRRMRWFLDNRRDLNWQISFVVKQENNGRRLLAIPSRDRLERLLRYLLDESEFLSPHGIRSVSRVHEAHPFVIRLDGDERRVDYEPGESTTRLFGGNSNWRGPVWLPLNYLITEALERYHHFYGDTLQVECPTGSGHRVNLAQAAREIACRVSRLFLPDAGGASPWQGGERRYADDPHWRGLTLFHEFFHPESGRGMGASHQTGWTSLILRLLEDGCAR